MTVSLWHIYSLKGIMPRRCEIPSCFNEKKKSLFALPKDKEQREKWLTAIFRAYPDLFLGKNVFICENHFKDADVVSHRVMRDPSGNIFQQVIP